MAKAGDESGLLLERSLWCDGFENGFPQLRYAFTREGAHSQYAGRWRVVREIAFITDKQSTASGAARQVAGIVRRCKVKDDQRHVGVRNGLVAALDAERFDQLRGVADAGRIVELHRDAADGGGLADKVAG